MRSIRRFNRCSNLRTWNMWNIIDGNAKASYGIKLCLAIWLGMKVYIPAIVSECVSVCLCVSGLVGSWTCQEWVCGASSHRECVIFAACVYGRRCGNGGNGDGILNLIWTTWVVGTCVRLDCVNKNKWLPLRAAICQRHFTLIRDAASARFFVYFAPETCSVCTNNFDPGDFASSMVYTSHSNVITQGTYLPCQGDGYIGLVWLERMVGLEWHTNHRRKSINSTKHLEWQVPIRLDEHTLCHTLLRLIPFHNLCAEKRQQQCLKWLVHAINVNMMAGLLW